MYLNKAIIIGNLTRDPELKTLPSGTKVATLGVATNRVFKNKNGERQEDTQFHNVVVFGNQAEIVNQYLRKGQTVMVEGRIQTRSWDGQDGQKRYRTEIVADRVQFGPKSGSSQNSQTVSQPAAAEEVKTIQYPTEEVNPDDIPF
ncbi:MAG: single-stranded DNA-binding protein [Candidatus Vogelbacteria bacterium]|nr:single-stranded DNA-binding protein [Candidatus Vogelbacteria bacterium]